MRKVNEKEENQEIQAREIKRKRKTTKEINQ